MSVEVLQNEIRYAERLCLRTARLYRRVGTCSTFLSVLGGSAAITSLSATVSPWVSVSGVAVLAMFGAINLAVRPAEKATSIEADARKYAQLRSAGRSLGEADLRAALDKARETDGNEIEPLRDVAFNDVVREVGHPEAAVPLNLQQRLLSVVA
jgi:hypothetical protein